MTVAEDTREWCYYNSELVCTFPLIREAGKCEQCWIYLDTMPLTFKEDKDDTNNN